MNFPVVMRPHRSSLQLFTRPRGGAWTALTWGLLALGLYVATCAPGVGWQDSGIHQYRILTGQLEHSRGLALSHPLHYWLGRALINAPLPLGEPAYRLNLLSALFGALGVGLVAGTVANLTRSRFAAGCAALAVLLAHSYWQMSVVTEVYTLAAALMTVEWCLLLRYTQTRRPWVLIAVFAVNGLHFGAHQFALLTLATYAIVLLVRIWRGELGLVWLLLAAVAWALTGLPNWLMMLAYYQQTHDLAATIHSVLFGAGWAGDVLNTSISWGQVKLAGLSLGYSFPSLVVPLALVGLLRPARRRGRVFRRVLIAQTIIIGGFVGRYPIVDLYTFFVPVCALLGVWFGLGVDRLMRSVRRRGTRRWLIGLLTVNALLPLAVYLYFPVLAQQHQVMRSRLRDLPVRDEYRYFFQPWRCTDNSAATFARDALARTRPGGWLLADSTTGPTTAYVYLVHGGPAGLRIYSERTCLNVPGNPELSDAELATFLAAGGRALLVPGPAADQVWGAHFVLDKRGPDFWHIRTNGATP